MSIEFKIKWGAKNYEWHDQNFTQKKKEENNKRQIKINN